MDADSPRVGDFTGVATGHRAALDDVDTESGIGNRSRSRRAGETRTRDQHVDAQGRRPWRRRRPPPATARAIKERT
jgi:hypothetical protein